MAADDQGRMSLGLAAFSLEHPMLCLSAVWPIGVGAHGDGSSLAREGAIGPELRPSSNLPYVAATSELHVPPGGVESEPPSPLMSLPRWMWLGAQPKHLDQGIQGSGSI